MDNKEIVFEITKGLPYSVPMMKTDEGFRVGGQLIRLIAPILAVLLDEKMAEDIRLEESEVFTKIASHVAFNLDEEQLIQVVDKVLLGLHRGSQPVDWREHFAGNYGEFIVVLEKALRGNFGQLFTDYFKVKGIELPTLGELVSLLQEGVKLTYNEELTKAHPLENEDGGTTT